MSVPRSEANALDSAAVSQDDVDIARVVAMVRNLLVESHPDLPIPDIGPDSQLLAVVGLDSLSSLELRDRLEAEFEVTIPDTVFTMALTPRDWLRAIRSSPGEELSVALDASSASNADDAVLVPPDVHTLLDALDFRARNQPDQVHLRLLHYPESASPPRDLTYRQMWTTASAVAGRLSSRGIRHGDAVALMLPTMPEYFGIFLGVMLAGAIPVPIYPPARLSEIEDHLRRQIGILTNAGVRMIVVPPQALRLSRVLRMSVPSLEHVLVPADLESGAVHPWRVEIASSDIGLLQYTSGSTGDPKGVVLTHGDLLANIVSMGEAVHVQPDDIFVSWLPLYHDMGLIAAWLTGIYYGFRVVIMAPTAFLARPERWLHALSAEHGTISAAPNFSYEYCAALSDHQLEGVDLSSWRLAFNGSESVRPATIGRFCDRFAPYGFKREAMTPAYGLAEAGVGVTFSPPGRGPLIDTIARRDLVKSASARPVPVDDPDRLEFVSCGTPLAGYEVRILSPDDEELPERHEGRVEFAGPSATCGYYRNEAATSELVDGRWLDTGDLGYLADGELYLTGRNKDLIIRAGQNLHPEELEEAVSSLSGIRSGRVAVFSSVDPKLGTERLVVMAETVKLDDLERTALRSQIVATSLRLIGTPPDDVVLVPPNVVVLTASGKLARAACRERYSRGELSGKHPPTWLQLLYVARSGVGDAITARLRRMPELIYGTYAFAMAIVVAGCCWPVVVLLPIPQRWRYRIVRVAANLLRRLIGLRSTVIGTLPEERPLLIVANHASFIDGAVLIAALPMPMTFVVGAVFERQRLIGSFLSHLGCIFAESGSAVDAALLLERLTEVLRSGRTLATFPEGGLEPSPGLREFHLGGLQAAVHAGVSVVPVGISGSRTIVAPGTRFPRRGAVRVEIGARIVPSAMDWESVIVLRDETRATVEKLCNNQVSQETLSNPRFGSTARG